MTRRLLFLFGLALALATTSVAHAGGIKVLDLEANGDVTIGQVDLAAIITGDARFDVSNSAAYDYAQSGNPTLAYLAGFDSVLVSSNQLPNIALFDLLADYVDGGGHVVISTFIGQEGFGGRLLTTGYSALTTGTFDAYNPASLGAYDPLHPIMAGVTSLSVDFYRGDFLPGLDAGATLVASWDDGRPLVAVNGAGNVVNVTIFPGVLNPVYSTPITGDVALLFANALAYNQIATPEPATVVNLIAVALVSVGFLRRKRSAA
jgi:hypothetical protein